MTYKHTHNSSLTRVSAKASEPDLGPFLLPLFFFFMLLFLVSFLFSSLPSPPPFPFPFFSFSYKQDWQARYLTYITFKCTLCLTSSEKELKGKSFTCCNYQCCLIFILCLTIITSQSTRGGAKYVDLLSLLLSLGFDDQK